jgi:hypothetical protein
MKEVGFVRMKSIGFMWTATLLFVAYRKSGDKGQGYQVSGVNPG